MIEIYDIKEREPERYDIISELDVIKAYNTMIQFCKSQPAGSGEDGTCGRCILYNHCPSENDLLPEDWPELHFPRLIGNTVEYLKDGKVHKITHGNREEAEATMRGMTR